MITNLINKRSKKIVEATYTMNKEKGGYDLKHKDGKEEFLSVADFNKKYEFKIQVVEAKKSSQEVKEVKEAKPKKEVKPKEAKKEVKETPSKAIETPSKPLEAKKNIIAPNPIIEASKKEFENFVKEDENLLLDEKVKFTNLKYNGRVLAEIHYQKKGMRILFVDKFLSQENLNLCTMVNPKFKWSTNMEYKYHNEKGLANAINMIKESYKTRKEQTQKVEKAK